MVSTSCSLLHSAVDLKNETKLDAELKSWLAFAAQKLLEVVALASAAAGKKDEVMRLAQSVFYCSLRLAAPKSALHLKW